MPTTLRRRKVDLETKTLRATLAGAACLIIAGALLGNAASVLLALAACLACGSRLERNYQRGLYGRRPIELVD
jgi:hypothetical protein